MNSSLQVRRASCRSLEVAGGCVCCGASQRHFGYFSFFHTTNRSHGAGSSAGASPSGSSAAAAVKTEKNACSFSTAPHAADAAFASLHWIRDNISRVTPTTAAAREKTAAHAKHQHARAAMLAARLPPQRPSLRALSEEFQKKMVLANTQHSDLAQLHQERVTPAERPGKWWEAKEAQQESTPSASPSLPPSAKPQEVVRLPRILFFGGDIVSVTALEALYERMYCIIQQVLYNQQQQSYYLSGRREAGSDSNDNNGGGLSHSGHQGEPLSYMTELIEEVLRDHITVICPALPAGMTAAEVAKKYKNNKKQYPVLRFCVEKKLHVIPVDHAKSFKKSKLLQDMLRNMESTSSPTEHDNSKQTSNGSRHQHHHHNGNGSTNGSKSRQNNIILDALRAANKDGPSVTDTDSPSLGAGSATTNETRRRNGTSAPGSSRVPVHTCVPEWESHGHSLGYYDLAVVVSFRYFLPLALLRALPPTINMHPSLLPHYRGASPIFSTLLRNEERGGVSIIQIKKEDTALMDSGHVLWQCEVPIEADTDIRTYFPLVTQIGAAGLCDLIYGEGRPPSSTLPTAAAPTELPGDMATKEQTKTPSWCCAGHARKEWTTLCRPPTQLTSTVLESAIRTHRECFYHNCFVLQGGNTSSAGKGNRNGGASSPSASFSSMTFQDTAEEDSPYQRRVDGLRSLQQLPPQVDGRATEVDGNNKSSGAKARETLADRGSETQTITLKCAEVFPQSVVNPYCNWPDSFTYSWRFSQSQNYEIFVDTEADGKKAKSSDDDAAAKGAHKYKYDPYHAPLLPKDAAVQRFSAISGLEAYGIWRAFVGGQYFSPAVNATMDKGSTPVRNQLVRRHVRQLVRRENTERRKKAAAASSSSQGKKKQKRRPSPPSHVRAADPQEKWNKPKPPPPNLDEVDITKDMVQESIQQLRISCSFTQAMHPLSVPEAVLRELYEVEHQKPIFYQPPPPLFQSVLTAEEEEEEELPAVVVDTARDALRARETLDASTRTSLSSQVLYHTTQTTTSSTSATTTAADASGSMSYYYVSNVLHCTCARPEDGALMVVPRRSCAATLAVKKMNKAALQTLLRSMLFCEDKDTAEGSAAEEETPADYVPDVILGAPPNRCCTIYHERHAELPTESAASTTTTMTTTTTTSTSTSITTTEHSTTTTTTMTSYDRTYYIPPGTGYFPRSDETIGCIKCDEGWFFWTEAHLKHSSKAQPAALLRKGLAIKTGILYTGLFSEYL